MKKFPLYKQYDQMDCGPTCLRMVSKHYGRSYTMDTLRQKSGFNREGVSLLGISEAAEHLGFRTVGAKLTWEQLDEQAQLPCVVWWNQVHFVVVYKIKKNWVFVADPVKGKIRYSKEELLQENQTLTSGQPLFYIQPENTSYFGELAVSQASFGKKVEGQSVLERFSGYPYYEYGSVFGRMDYISDFPVRDSLFFGFRF